MTNEQRLRILYKLKAFLRFDENMGRHIYICHNIVFCFLPPGLEMEFRDWFNQQRPKRIKEKDIEDGWWPEYDYTSRLRFLNRLIKKLENEIQAGKNI